MKAITNLVTWARIKSPWIVHFNCGACNGCDIETLDALTPRYDLERFGVLLKASPRHGDVLVVTGAVTRQIKDRLIRVYNQMPEPKWVIAMGACAVSGGVFNTYSVVQGLDQVMPVDVYLPGCPPRPEALIHAIMEIQKKIEKESFISKTTADTAKS